jgi:hypothetical protein
VAGNVLLIEQLPQQLSDRSAYRVDRTGIAAKPPDDPRDIDSAPAGIAPLRLAAQLGHRQDPVDRRREIDRRVRSDRDDIGHCIHWLAPAARAGIDRTRLRFGSVVAIQFLAQRQDDAVGGFDVLGRDVIGKTVDPGTLQAQGGVVGLPSLVGQHHELRPAVMRIGLE